MTYANISATIDVAFLLEIWLGRRCFPTKAMLSFVMESLLAPLVVGLILTYFEWWLNHRK